MTQQRLWNEPSYPRLEELPPPTRQKVLVALSRLIRHHLDNHRRPTSARGKEEKEDRMHD